MKKLYLMLFFSALTLSAMCQTGVVTTGGTAIGNGGSVTYTVGQIAVQRMEAGDKYVIEGVQQPYEIQTVGVDDYPDIVLEAILFPNPTTSTVRLRISNYEIPSYGLTAELFDIHGRMIQIFTVSDLETQMDLSSLPSASYQLRVLDDSRLLKTFKVIKNKQ
ncbi:MAG: T9SS type A sorting domain-containing protein [Bacteroidales bacterium]|nr:T9SS type A sorting domain-containing protein [Bacteroidales bacterium]